MSVPSQAAQVATDEQLERERLHFARVLVEIGELDEAEDEVLRLLGEHPDDHEIRSLLAKIKHIKGELTEAFAWWAQAHAMNPETGAAQMRLDTLLQLVRDPERGAGEFLVVGRLHLWRKPAQMLELERIFQLFVRRKPGEAREASVQLARKYHGSDPDIFKLATLAEAWMAELSGDLEGAGKTLEELGRERGLENDIDRALALVRVYEQVGSSESLEKAVHVCEFLARTLRSFERVTALGRLAALHRQLGSDEEAEALETEFAVAFRRRMHRVSLGEATAVASIRYVPLGKLQAVRFHDVRVPEEMGTRQRALVHAVTGGARAAAELLEGSEEVLDLMYRGDLAAVAGDWRAAVRFHREAFARDPSEPQALLRLLDQASNGDEVGAEAIAAIAEEFAPAAVAARVRELLEGTARDYPLVARTWRRLAALHRLRGDEQQGLRCAERAAALAAANARRGRAVGRALSAAVYHFAGGSKGLIHEVWAERRAVATGKGQLTEVLGSAAPELEKTIRNIFVSVREYARAKLPHQSAGFLDYAYAFKITKEDEPSHGLSAGLPAALAFLSAFLDRPLLQDMASSGELVADAHDVLVVRPVGESEYKVRGAYNRNLRMLILPEGNRAALEASPMVPRLICDELVRFVSDLDEAVTLAFGPEIWVD